MQPMRIHWRCTRARPSFRDGDYFGRWVNARLRSLAEGGQILCSVRRPKLVIDSLLTMSLLADLGLRQLKNLARPEHVFALRLEDADDILRQPTAGPPMERGCPACRCWPVPPVRRARARDWRRS